MKTISSQNEDKGVFLKLELEYLDTYSLDLDHSGSQGQI